MSTIPPKSLLKKFDVQQLKVANTQISCVQSKTPSSDLLIFIHGGAFISGPAPHHWDVVKEICTQTNATVWVCNYPKAPENDIIEISSNIDAVYKAALEKYAAKNIQLIGDSVGDTLVSTLTQRLISNQT